MRRRLEDAQADQEAVDLFLFFDAIIDLVLEIGQAFDFDLFVSKVLQLFTGLFNFIFFCPNLSLETLISFLKLNGPRQLLESLRQLRGRVLRKAQGLQLILIDHEFRPFQIVDLADHSIVFLVQKRLVVILVHDVFVVVNGFQIWIFLGPLFESSLD